jgi:hypothetical protein
MAKYLYRSCPRCNGYVGIVLPEPARNAPVQAVNGHCLRCGWRLSWIVIRGGLNELSCPCLSRSPLSQVRSAESSAGSDSPISEYDYLKFHRLRGSTGL